MSSRRISRNSLRRAISCSSTSIWCWSAWLTPSCFTSAMGSPLFGRYHVRFSAPGVFSRRGRVSGTPHVWRRAGSPAPAWKTTKGAAAGNSGAAPRDEARWVPAGCLRHELHDAVGGADRHAGRLAAVARALVALRGVDDVLVGALGDRLARALGLAGAAAAAVFGDLVRHVSTPSAAKGTGGKIAGSASFIDPGRRRVAVLVCSSRAIGGVSVVPNG